MNQHRAAITNALNRFTDGSLAENARNLLNTLGYGSERALALEPNTADAFIDAFDLQEKLNHDKALTTEWASINPLFQLRGEDLTRTDIDGWLFDPSQTQVDNTIIESYLFLALWLDGSNYNRTQLSQITREINKLFPMPAMLLFQHGNTLTLSVINRRLGVRDQSRDVLEKVTLIKDIDFKDTHCAHIDILFDLALEPLNQTHGVHNFVELHRAWEKTLDTEELNKQFYRDLFDWFERAVAEGKFPTDKNRTLKPEEHVIRLITRLLFVWFMKEKRLVAEELFNETQVSPLLKDYDRDTGDSYYRTVLQNLFFATLNTEIGKRGFSEGGNPGHRNFSLYRYKDEITDSDKLLTLFAQTPFINGGLFDCLDSEEATRDGGYRIDCFSDVHYNKLSIPNRLFFDKQRGLFPLLEHYKFTVEENTPIEQDVALDPELLGRVFENLLAAYNPETGTTARKQTGSYYTPRPIVDYMVDEALVAVLSQKCNLAEDWLRSLLDYTQMSDNGKKWSDNPEADCVVKAISQLKILDPAVGSGAFPMGVLHKLTLALQRLDLDNSRWEKLQKERTIQRAAAAFDTKDRQTRDEELKEISRIFENYSGNFGRKLYLIQNSIFGLDIQSIACQIAKLRFFISLAIEQELDRDADNFGIKPLPNLEPRFIAANTLIGLEEERTLTSQKAKVLEGELDDNRERHFHATTRPQKLACRREDKKLRRELATELRHIGMPADDADKVADWDPYDQNASADWFDSKWMFGITDGFDVVIGNPPYRQVHKGVHSAAQFPYSEGRDKGKQNLYKLFVEQSYNLCKRRGVVTLIVQSSLMCDLSSAVTRQLLLEHTQLKHIIEFPKTAQSREVQVFTTVTQGTCIYQFTKALPNGEPIKISVGNDAHSIADLRFSAITKEAIMNLYPELRYFPHIGEGSVSILEKIADDETINPLKHYIADIIQGDLNLTTHSSRFSRVPSAVRLLRGWHVNRFVVKYDDADEYCEEGFMVDKVAANRSSTFLICQQITGTVDLRRLHFALTANPSTDFLWGNSVNKMLLKNWAHSKTFLALLNSKFMDWFFRITSTNNHVQGYELEQLPIPVMSDDNREKLNNLAGQVMEAKRTDPDADVSELENKIDQIVYLLYGLDADEIEIVEEAENV